MSAHPYLDQALWYRFEMPAGTRMPTRPPGYEACGTTYTGWLASPMPPRGQGVTTSTVCFQNSHSYGNGCGYRKEIQTCTCSYDGGYTDTYLYRLVRPDHCDMAYCGTEEVLPPPPPSSAPQ